jgi:membrane-bound lytic murein transglycosylase D
LFYSKIKTMLNFTLKLFAGNALLFISMPAGSHLNGPVNLHDSTANSNEVVASAKVSANASAIKLNKNAAHFVKDYIRRNDELFTVVRKRGEKHFPMMDSIFNKYDLPIELKYLAVVESELKPTATSCVGAKGPWQLMPETAKILGLKVTKRYDERTHYRKSTRAAAIYLKDLHREFGDWLLVLAAYNSGPGPVYAAIKKSGSRNFWKLQHYLPAESRGHVKKFIATHYFFEGQGGITTLTKSEWTKLLAAK